MTEIPSLLAPVLIPKLDRRKNHLTIPECPECAREHPAVVARTDFVLYLRCTSCHGIWSVWKPGRV